METLTSIGPTGAVEPFLAKSIAVSDDGRTYRFDIREGVRFHNGDALTAADVAANIERVKVTVKGGWLSSAMKLVESVEASDNEGAGTVTLKMSRPYAPLLNLMSELWILSPKSKGWEGTIEQPIGTGPFKFGEWQPKVRLTTQRNDAYWQAGLPHLATVQFDLREDVDKALALRAGDIHIATVTRDVAKQLKDNPDFVVGALKDSSWHFVSFNNRKPRKPFDDVRVRKAVMYAVDKSAFMRFVGGDTAVVTNQLVLPSSGYFDRAMHEADPHAKSDLDRARVLLSEAGVDPSAVTVELISWQESAPQIAVQMIRRLGFKVNHVALDDLGAQKRLGQYDWDVAVMSSGPRADVFLRYVRLMSDGPNPVLWGGVQDVEFDQLVKQAVAEPEFERRKRDYLAAWQRVMDNYYTVVLGHAFEPLVWRKEVRGYEPGFTYAPHWASGGLAHAYLSA